MKHLLSLFCALLLPFALSAGPEKTVSGLVTGADDGQPILNCFVLVKHASRGTATDHLGRYSIDVVAGDTLQFSFVGYCPLEVPVDDRMRIDAVLSPDDSQLSECVVVAYGHTGRKTGFVGRAMCARDGSRHRPNTEEYARFEENRFRSALDRPLSTFSLESDGASYANCRRMLAKGLLPPEDAVRIEELVNYFTYDYPQPEGDDPLSLVADAGPCPWNAGHRLVRIALRAREVAKEAIPPSHLVYLIDVSGSMSDVLPMVQASMKLLTDNLRPEDRVSIVTYASGVKEVLTAVPGSERRRIKDAVDALEARGATSGGAGLQLAYKVAADHFISGGNNRIVLCSDGDFNVGASSDEAIEALIERMRIQTGVYLSVLGYGMGNYKDRKMQLMAEKGNGNYAYVDDMAEAMKTLFHEFGATTCAVADDAKLQVEFNPALVASYRLVGYESRLLRDEDFNDDRKDAGEIGAGRCVTALYEVIPEGAEEHPAGTVDPLRYRNRGGTPVVTIPSSEMLTVKVRYKRPGERRSRLMQTSLVDGGAQELRGDFAFAAAVAMFGQILRTSDFMGEATFDDVVALASEGLGTDPGGYRSQFLDLVRIAQSLRNSPAVPR